MDQEFTHSEDEEEVVDVADEAAPFAEQESPVPPPGPDEPEDEDGDEDEKEHGTISSDLIRGHINTIILRSLYDGDKYGYAILEEIARKSHNQYQLKQPSLYSALKRLEKEGYITSYWGGTAGGGRRKYFSLTDQGKEVAERNLMEWEYSRTVIDSLISDKDFDFSSPAPSPVDMRVLRQSTSRVPTGGNDEAADEGDAREELAVSDTAEWDEPSQEPDETAEAPLSPLPADAIADSMPDLTTDSEELPADETAEPSSEETAPEESAEYPADTAPEKTLPNETPEPSEQPVSPAYAAAEAGPATLSEPAPEGNETDEMTAAGEEAPAEATEATAPLPEDHPALLELQAQRAAFEEEQRRAQEELRAREEMLRTREELFRSEEEQRNRMIAEEAAKNRYWEELRAREHARLEEEQRRRMEAEAIARLRYEDELRRRGEERRMMEEARLAEEARRAEEERLAEEQRLRRRPPNASGPVSKRRSALPGRKRNAAPPKRPASKRSAPTPIPSPTKRRSRTPASWRCSPLPRNAPSTNR